MPIVPDPRCNCHNAASQLLSGRPPLWTSCPWRWEIAETVLNDGVSDSSGCKYSSRNDRLGFRTVFIVTKALEPALLLNLCSTLWVLRCHELCIPMPHKRLCDVYRAFTARFHPYIFLCYDGASWSAGYGHLISCASSGAHTCRYRWRGHRRPSWHVFGLRQKGAGAQRPEHTTPTTNRWSRKRRAPGYSRRFQVTVLLYFQSCLRFRERTIFK